MRPMINNGIQRLIPSEKKTCRTKDNSVESENNVPGFNTLLLADIYTDKIGSSGIGISPQAEACGKTAYYPSEYADQKCVIGDDYIGKDIDKYTRHHNYQHRIDSILLSYKTKADIYRKCIEHDIDKSIRKVNSKKLVKYMLKEYGYARNSRGIKPACIYESIDIQGQQNRTRDHQCNSFQSSKYRVFFQTALLPDRSTVFANYTVLTGKIQLESYLSVQNNNLKILTDHTIDE